MSIATEITKLNNNIEKMKTIKQEIKDAVNSDFEEITNEQIENYAEKIEETLELYKDYIPSIKTNQNTEIIVTDAMKYSRNKLELFGNTELTQYSKNTMTDTTDNSVDKNGINITSEPNGIFTFNGTANAAINEHFPSLIGKTYNIPVGDYYIHYEYISGTLDAIEGAAGRLIINLIGTGDTIANQIILLKNDYQRNKSVAKSITNDAEITKAQIMILNGTVLNNLKFRVWWSKSEDNVYEPYIGEDASNSPQHIHVVTGENTITVGETNYPLNLGNIELCKIEDYQDKIIKVDDTWKIPNKIIKIDSYDDETITTSYISTTGSLDEGATVYYVGEEDYIITDETLIAQLEVLYEHLPTVKGTNHITVTEQDIKPYMQLNYKSLT